MDFQKRLLRRNANFDLYRYIYDNGLFKNETVFYLHLIHDNLVSDHSDVSNDENISECNRRNRRSVIETDDESAFESNYDDHSVREKEGESNLNNQTTSVFLSTEQDMLVESDRYIKIEHINDYSIGQNVSESNNYDHSVRKTDQISKSDINITDVLTEDSNDGLIFKQTLRRRCVEYTDDESENDCCIISEDEYQKQTKSIKTNHSSFLKSSKNSETV